MEVSNLINSMVAEVKTDYILANKKSILDYILSNPEEFKRLGLLFMPNPPKLYGQWSNGVKPDPVLTRDFEKSYIQIEDELPIFNEMTRDLQTLWVEKYQRLVDFNPWEFYKDNCKKGTNLQNIGQFFDF